MQGRGEQRAGSTRATHGEHPEQEPQAGGDLMGTAALLVWPEVLEAVAAQQAEGRAELRQQRGTSTRWL